LTVADVSNDDATRHHDQHRRQLATRVRLLRPGGVDSDPRRAGRRASHVDLFPSVCFDAVGDVVEAFAVWVKDRNLRR
jgi:hypothetical protein